MVVYRVDAARCLVRRPRRRSVEYAGFPAAGAGVAGADTSLKIAFFALLTRSDDLSTPIGAFARDEAGNEASVGFVDNVFPKPFRKSRIELDDRFLQRVVPDILTHSPELGLDPRGADVLPAFLKINGELRRAERRADRGAHAKRLDRRGSGTGPSSSWATRRSKRASRTTAPTSISGKEVDQQVHLGFDLAVDGRVAGRRGQRRHGAARRLAGHLRQLRHHRPRDGRRVALRPPVLDRREGRRRGQARPAIGRSGMTGLAGGDHLHFTMLVSGRAVNPVEWWDPHWIADRIDAEAARRGGGKV